jgi:hypothetical protein
MKLGERVWAFALGFLVVSSDVRADVVYSCEHDFRLLVLENARDGRQVAWQKPIRDAGKVVVTSCYFNKGHSYKLTDLNLYLDRSVEGMNVTTYAGIGDHCSEGELLVFNDKTKTVLIVTVSDFSNQKYICSRS